jgi:hypothetical protein
MKFMNFFLFLWVIFALLDPDTDSGSGYGSTHLIKIRIPGPKHWYRMFIFSSLRREGGTLQQKI